jgi:peptidoglycan/LPS O-acetylase OafA/YrhL
MTATTTFTAPITRPAVRRSATTKRLWKTGAIAGVSASVATFAVGATAKALDVPIEVGGKAIPLFGFAQLTFVGAIIGTILAVRLSRRADRPRRTFVITTVALTLLSIVPDVLADTQTATRFTLALTHVVAAAIVIPALSSRLSD